MARCPLCNCQQTIPITYRENVPCNQNLLFETENEAIGINKGTLSMEMCTECTLTFNSSFNNDLIKYDRAYDNNQMYSKTFITHIGQMLKIIQSRLKKNNLILEIGCGSGEFLKSIIDSDLSLKGIGIDPAYNGQTKSSDRLSFISEKISDQDINPDFIILRHIIEHIPNPIEFMDMISKHILPTTELYIETPSVSWILKNNIIWDLFYEHCTLYNNSSISYLLKQYVSPTLIEKAFDGQYLITYGRTINTLSSEKSKETELSYATSYRKNEELIYSLYKEQLDKGNHKFGIWGVGGKGVAFANLFDPYKKDISAGIEINKAKIGKFIPGTGHPIISIEDMKRYGIDRIILLNPNYKQEAQLLLKQYQLDNVKIMEVL